MPITPNDMPANIGKYRKKKAKKKPEVFYNFKGIATINRVRAGTYGTFKPIGIMQ